MSCLVSRRAVLVGWLLAVACVFPHAVATAEISDWKNRDGGEMQAELIGYDLQEKKVRFQKDDGTTYAYPLEELDLNGKVAVVTDDRFSEWLVEEGWEKPPVAEMIGTVGAVFFLSLAGYLVAVLVIQWLCFWFAARMVTGERGFRLHLFGWLKALVSSVVAQIICFVLIAILGVVLGALFSSAAALILAAADPSPAIGAVSCCLQWVMLAVGLAVPAWFVANHYDLNSIWSGLGIIVLSNFLTTIAFLVFLGVLFYLAREYGDMIFTDWLLRPLQLV